jgi:murein DD-endopeptidase MepM/ murein hydrolase activator NlpD
MRIPSLTVKSFLVLGLLLLLTGANMEPGKSSPQANPKFLTYPFPSHPDMKVQLGWHNGIDYIRGTRNNKSTWTNFDVLAPADGQACKFWWEAGQWNVGGWYVRIAHTVSGINFTTEYNHLDSAESFIPLCNTSTPVTRGQKIGVAGDRNLSNCSPPCKHLHFELRVNSTIPNPNGTKTDPYDIWNQNATLYPDPNTGPRGLMGDHYWTTDPPSYYNNCCCSSFAVSGGYETSMLAKFPFVAPLVRPVEITPISSIMPITEPLPVQFITPILPTPIQSKAISSQRTPPTSANYQIPKSVMGAGGGAKTSTNYVLQGTNGQVTGVGQRESSSYILQSGYWREATAPSSWLVYLPAILK